MDKSATVAVYHMMQAFVGIGGVAAAINLPR